MSTEPTRAGAAGDQEPLKPTRRGVLIGAVAATVGAVAGVSAGAAIVNPQQTDAPRPDPDAAAPGAAAPAGTPVDATGANQAGIARPHTPQRFGRVRVLDLDDDDDPTAWLAAIGARILELTAGAPEVLPDGAGDLTVTVGLGPRLVAAIDPGLPGTEELPSFAGDDSIPASARGGDLLLAAYSSDPGALVPVLDDLGLLVPAASTRWEQAAFRGPGEGTKVRNPLGFHDGVIVPHGDAELDENVWIGSGAAAGGAICVIRRLRLDAERFRALPVDEQQQIFGRRRDTGAPLSGGGPDAQIDLSARTPEGDPVIPANAHARAAHPSFTGSALMLRRGYAFDNGDGDSGLMFICFQHDLRTFVATQQRLDDVDALHDFTHATASATFLILPGFDRERPLGSTLRA